MVVILFALLITHSKYELRNRDKIRSLIYGQTDRRMKLLFFFKCPMRINHEICIIILLISLLKLLFFFYLSFSLILTLIIFFIHYQTFFPIIY